MTAHVGLEDWERQIIDTAVLYRSVVLQQIPTAFTEQVRALAVLDAPRRQLDDALRQLHADIIAAADQALTEAQQNSSLHGAWPE